MHRALAEEAVAGGGAKTLATLPNNSEVPLTPAYDLHVDGYFLYFLRSTGAAPFADGYVSLYRMAINGSSEPVQIASGQNMRTPVFQDDWIYLAYTRGGDDTPIESGIARIEKQPLCIC